MNTWNRHIHTGTQNVRNVHNAHIYDIGISKHKQHLRLLSSGTKLLYYLWVKRFFDIRREAQSFYADLSICTPPSFAVPVAHKFVSPRPISTNWLFSNLSPRFRSGRHSHPSVIFSIWGFYFDISKWHILPARVSIPAINLHLTNPCAKLKVLSLTKPKGKIYKTKSLGHYIT